MVSAIATAAITSIAARLGSVSRTSVGRIGALSSGLAVWAGLARARDRLGHAFRHSSSQVPLSLK